MNEQKYTFTEQQIIDSDKELIDYVLTLVADTFAAQHGARKKVEMNCNDLWSLLNTAKEKIYKEMFEE